MTYIYRFIQLIDLYIISVIKSKRRDNDLTDKKIREYGITYSIFLIYSGKTILFILLRRLSDEWKPI